MVAEIEALMPGSNCGQCGFAGCPAGGGGDRRRQRTGDPLPAGRQGSWRRRWPRNWASASISPPSPMRGRRSPSSPKRHLHRLLPLQQSLPDRCHLGAAKQIHNVIREACTGCGNCIDRCPTEALLLQPLPITVQHWVWPKPATAPVALAV
jgi:electron transport complex protein RnfB